MLCHVTARAFQYRERRMSLVEMADVRLDANRLQHPPSTDAENDLLLQAQLAVAAIELAGNASIRRCIRRIVGVHQIQPHTADLHLPHANPYGRTGNGDRKPHPFAAGVTHRSDRKLAGVIEGIERPLATVYADVLPKVSLLIEKTDSDDRNSEVVSRFQQITGNVPEAAGIDRQRFAQHEFHAEVRD